MRNIIFILCLCSTICYSQNIDLITYSPQNPQPGDTLTIICHLTYGVPCCNGVREKNIYLGGNAIFAESFFCLDTITNHQTILYPETDTFYFATDPQLIITYPFYYMPGYHDEAPCMYPYLTSGQPLPHPYVIGHIDIPVGTVSTNNTIKQKENLLKISPNPANSQVILHWEGNENMEYPVQIYDMTGQLIREINMNNPIKKIDVSSLDNGLYIFKLQTDKGIMTEKLLIQH